MKYVIKPVIVINNKNTKAKYYDDGSGYLIIESEKNYQDVYATECGRINDHIKDLKTKIRLMKSALLTLEKKKVIIDKVKSEK